MNLKPLGRTRKAPHQLTSCSLLSPRSFEPGSGGSSRCWCYAVCWFSLFLLATSQAGAKALVRKSHNPLAVLLSSAKTMRQGSHFKVEHGVMLEHQDASGNVSSPSHLHHQRKPAGTLVIAPTCQFIHILQTLKLHVTNKHLELPQSSNDITSPPREIRHIQPWIEGEYNHNKCGKNHCQDTVWF